jgi:hypothetical protein
MAAWQRKEPVGAVERTHGIRYQSNVRFRQLGWPERQLYEAQPTAGRGRAVSLLRRLLLGRANWRYRPSAVFRPANLGGVKQRPRSVNNAG